MRALQRIAERPPQRRLFTSTATAVIFTVPATLEANTAASPEL
jgi:hypothetical protein